MQALATLAAQTLAAQANAEKAKAADKATAKPRTQRKADSKADQKAAAKPANKAVAQAIKPFASAAKFTFSQGARPTAGVNLHSYTQAWMNLTGMAAGKAVPRDVIKQLAGGTAISYHLNTLKNFEETKEGLRLTAKGKTFFAGRQKDDKQTALFEAAMRTGSAIGEGAFKGRKPEALK